MRFIEISINSTDFGKNIYISQPQVMAGYLKVLLDYWFHVVKYPAIQPWEAYLASENRERQLGPSLSLFLQSHSVCHKSEMSNDVSVSSSGLRNMERQGKESKQIPNGNSLANVVQAPDT